MTARSSVLAVTAAALALAGPLAGDVMAQDLEPFGPRATPAPTVRIEKALLTEMNRVRAQHGRAALRPHAGLRRAAREQSRYLLGIGELTHEGTDGAPFWTRLVAAGFPRARSMAENLAMVPGCEIPGARRAVQLWMRSPGHRANLLDRRFRWVGSGIAASRDCSATYVTADYGS